MRTSSSAPFSARNRREKNWIEEGFPASARNGLLHLLTDAMEKNHLLGWLTVAKEFRRIVRFAPFNYDPSLLKDIDKARFDSESILNQLDWEKVYDFCERLYSNLAQDTVFYENGEPVTIMTKAQSQLYFTEELQHLFEEENLAYEFREGLVQRRGKRHTIDQVTKAEKALADLRLENARKHFSKALHYFRIREKPDFENAVKEAVCAVEAASKELFPDAKAATLGDFIKWATSNEHSLLPKTIGQTLTGLYAFRNGGEGVSHGATLGGVATAELSEYVLGIAASQIILLGDLASNDEDPPF